MRFRKEKGRRLEDFAAQLGRGNETSGKLHFPFENLIVLLTAVWLTGGHGCVIQ